MNELVVNHQNVIGQKDKQLAEFQKQVDTLQKAESDLTKLIEEQKAKNNVRRLLLNLPCYSGESRFHIPPHILSWIFMMIFLFYIFFSLTQK